MNRKAEAPWSDPTGIRRALTEGVLLPSEVIGL
jgi:hypothetical protein